MAKHCETFEHTADIGLAARGDTLGELFEALGEGLADLICPREQVRTRDTRPVQLQAEDVEALCVDFLVEVMTATQVDRFLVAEVRVRAVSGTCVRADLAGEPYDPDRHEWGHEVKAVTYHQLKVAREGDVWMGRVIVDV
jgi:SHS2 domain-containing protein